MKIYVYFFLYPKFSIKIFSSFCVLVNSRKMGLFNIRLSFCNLYLKIKKSIQKLSELFNLKRLTIFEAVKYLSSVSYNSKYDKHRQISKIHYSKYLLKFRN